MILNDDDKFVTTVTRVIPTVVINDRKYLNSETGRYAVYSMTYMQQQQ